MGRLNQTWQVETEGAALATELHRALSVSHRQAKGILDAGCVQVNGTSERRHGRRLVAGDTVAVAFDPGMTYQPLPPPKKHLGDSELKILWEDKHLVFVDKPAGLLTVPTEAQKPEACLAEQLTEHYRRRGFKKFKLFVVHRLDRHTSGVLVFAKTPEALHGLTDLFAEHRLHRVYKAVLVGELPEPAGVLNDVIVERQRSLMMAVVNEKDRKARFGKRAVTHFRVLERLPGHTFVEIKLETGRRNQIRVQFADRGYPLLGDPVYGEASPLIDRQALHAELLGFRHPVLEDAVTVEAPLPPDMTSALAALRARARVVRAEAAQQGEEGIYQPRAPKSKRMGEVQRARRFERIHGEPKGEQDASPKRPKPSRPGAPFRRKESEGRPGATPRPGKEGRKPAFKGKGRPERDGSRPPRRGGPGSSKPASGRPSGPRGPRGRKPEGR